MSRVEYNNNIFSFQGRIGRISYIIQNAIINIIGFKFIYYPAMGESLRHMQSTADGAQLIKMLSASPINEYLFQYMAAAPKETTLSIMIKFLFLIPLRLIDIKRIRDIVDDSLSNAQTVFFALVLSLPYVDMIATVALSLITPNRFAKDEFEKEVKQKDLNEARTEGSLAVYKKQFEDGKISRAEYMTAIAKLKKPNQ